MRHVLRRVLSFVLVGAHACAPGGSDERQPHASSSAPPTATPEVSVTRTPFGTTPAGEPVELFTLTNAKGIEIRAISYGGIILSLKAPDRNGVLEDVVLGYDNLDGYLEDTPYFGALIGRYGNRIADARFSLDGATFELDANDGANSLHGGFRGFDKQVWEGSPTTTSEGAGVVFTRVSPDGEGGYPGNLRVQVSYTLTDADELVVDYLATTDRATPINLTQHSYFNLAGHGNGDILGHRLTLAASRFTPVDETLIPTGESAPVEGTPFDFRSPHAIGERIAVEDLQIGFGGGYDHNFVLDREGAAEGELVLAARVEEPSSGRVMEIRTTEPGVQFYSGNFLDGTLTGKSGHVYGHRAGFCLETQHFPDSPNHPGFPSTILRPDSEYRSRTVFSFGVMDGGA